MKFNETKKVGLDIFFINIILLLFIYSKDGLSLMNLILSLVSSLAAVGLNVYFIIKGAKTKINKVFLIINMVIFIAVIGILISNFI